ncbi:MAG: amino acid adenylation domain-containing protein [Planctomycetota bacterium]
MANGLLNARAPVLTPAESGQTTFDALFRRQVALTPARAAVIQSDTEWTYQLLDEAASKIARFLMKSGVQRGDCVGICMTRCPQAIAAMLGIHRSGAAFVPLDPEYPADRLAYMVDDAKVRWIVTNGAARDAIRNSESWNGPKWFGANAVDVETVLRSDPAPKQSAIRGEDCRGGDPDSFGSFDASDLAYVMYTSGSTGKPKGVQIEHGALVAYCAADAKVYQLSENDRTLQFSTLNFDIAIEEIFPPLMTGGCVVVRPPERSAASNELSDLLERFNITAVHLATAYWHQWVDLMVKTGQSVPEPLRLMVVTGEKVSVAHYRRWQTISHDLLWCNAYGPTEATVTATVFIPTSDFDASNMPIGFPLPGYTARILDKDFKEIPADKIPLTEASSSKSPASESPSGELCIGGPALARGYLNRDEQTAAAFIEWDGPNGGERLYRTGDIARWLPDGQIEFGGRIDHQIKLGSYRIEPAEIEAVLNEHPDVSESLVCVDETDGQKFLMAHLAVQHANPSVDSLDSWLRDRLPVYMIPQRYGMRPEFPKTINGKIDRDVLDAEVQVLVARNGDFIEPRNEMERKLADLWAQTLNLPDIGIHDDFFHLGGSSLLVTRVVSELADDFEVDLPVRDFFAHPTIAMLAKHLRSLKPGASDDRFDEEAPDAAPKRPELKAGFFAYKDQRLFSVHYPPMEAGVQNLNHGIVFCASMANEQVRAHRNLQQLAVILAGQGHHVLRYDDVGTGNSTGEDGSATVTMRQECLREACSRLRNEPGIDRISVLGVRVGATVAATAQIDALHQLLLWDPVIDGANWTSLQQSFHDDVLQSLHRFPVQRRGGSDEAFGYSLNSKGRNDLSRLTLPPSNQVSCNRSVVILTNDYRRAEPDPRGVLTTWPVRECGDQVHWHRGAFTESAFSSPRLFDSAQKFFGQVRDREFGKNGRTP